MKVGLFFGSFNPIHIGHLIIANIMLESTDLEEVWFVVSPQNPFKKNKSLLHEFDRFDMVKLAIQDNYKFRVSDVEFHMPRPSYTVDTLAYLQDKYPANQFSLIIGEDNLEQFHRWKNYSQILEYYGLYVYQRIGAVKTDLTSHPKVKMVEAPLLEISATFIRSCVKQGRSIKYLVPERVEEYIKQKKFYEN